MYHYNSICQLMRQSLQEWCTLGIGGQFATSY
ncbi:hypothetical protein Goshw_022322 [Gossypium schwendimanii]|uniref:Uncharacterized protein n=1 Tax=Gossypium schwendimanii TaxID=34291 RepID=A0A7J9KUL8_GOSSC|nr:hypothetical protein [Gossypium schwendimanii]